jgi:phosphoribosyl 1,2-cyclic phosphodiesterase
MKICSLSSGSKGNSVFIQSEHGRILVDAGLSASQLKKRLESIGIDPVTIDAIVITHAHQDHVQGSAVFSRQFDTPIYGHPDTLDELTYIFNSDVSVIPWTSSFFIKDFHLKPFRLSHDAIPTVGYGISAAGKELVICTDLGVSTQEVEENLRGVNFVILESNHDLDMLMKGPYPWELKERIASRVGHLSNHETGSLLKSILNGRLQKIVLAHLSEENNSPDLAKDTIIEYIGPQFEDIIDTLEQRKVSSMYDL